MAAVYPSLLPEHRRNVICPLFTFSSCLTESWLEKDEIKIRCRRVENVFWVRMMAPESVIQNLHQKVWKLNYILSLPPISSPKFSTNSFLFHKPETTGLFFVYFFTVYIDIWSSADLMEFMLSDISKDNNFMIVFCTLSRDQSPKTKLSTKKRNKRWGTSWHQNILLAEVFMI